MKETGLMFKAPLVLAILAGQKTQTRRVVKRLPLRVNREANTMEVDVANIENGEFTKRVPCPMGQPGDRIYVRETWAYGIHAMGAMRDEDGPFVFAADGTTEGRLSDQWLPSIHMPKHAARIWLEITGVRVERLLSITEADAKAEGAVLKNSPAAHLTSYRRGFQELWESTGGDWPANPWVWVIDFKTISTTGRPA